ncbi:MAG: Sec-independent protein translocase protein TatB [Helicobacteraceae bacterium]|jgi:sec-independent protein translocase protein TatB|nr:Sec-independent protein translocase protein TatB [Helicobacteraceae bacterium]
MFGMGFAEILIIGVIAILFLGPDKLPETMVQIAKFFKSVKTTVASAKSSIEEELHIQEIKEEANSYKRQLTEASNELKRVSGVEDLKDEMRDIKKDVYVDGAATTETSAPSAPKKPEVVTFAKKSKKLDIETPEEDDSDTKPSENV